jgi:hypothetical protein
MMIHLPQDQINPMVTQNAIAYRQANGALTVSVITVMEIVRSFHQNQSIRRMNTRRNAQQNNRLSGEAGIRAVGAV